MTNNPAITALALIELIQRHIAEPGDNEARTEELRALFANPDDDEIHADYAVKVANELATVCVGIAAKAGLNLSAVIAEYRARVLARDDDSDT